MTWPDNIEDTVIYQKKEYVASQPQTIRMTENAPLEVFGVLKVNGVELGGPASGISSEDARDLMNTTIVAGPGVSVTPDDPGDKLTIATSQNVIPYGSSQTAALGDAGAYLRFTATSLTYTLPANSVVAFPVKTKIEGTCTAGPMTIVQGAGATVNKARSLATVSAFSAWTAIKVNTDEWDVHGDLV